MELATHKRVQVQQDGSTIMNQTAEKAQETQKSAYFMNVHQAELNRLSLQHRYLRTLMGGLTAAPVDLSRPNLRILDSGAANGLWLQDLQESLSTECRFVGADVEQRFFPDPAVPGVTMHRQSITEAWPQSWHGTFDYIHQRSTLVGAGHFPMDTCINNLILLLKPGGVIELMEVDLTDTRKNGPAMCDFMQLMGDVFEAVGVPRNFGRRLAGLLSTSQTFGTMSEVIQMTYGVLNTRKDLVEMSIKNALQTTEGLLDAASAMRLSVDHLKDLPQRLELELRTIGGVVDQVAVWAYKTAD